MTANLTVIPIGALNQGLTVIFCEKPDSMAHFVGHMVFVVAIDLQAALRKQPWTM